MIRVFIADDHAILRDGLRRILTDTREFTVVGEASRGEEVLELAAGAEWDVLVLDLSLADRNGREVLRGLRRVRPGLPVLVLSMHPAGPWTEQLFEEGARGYVSKGEPAERLLDGLRTVAAGGWLRPVEARASEGSLRAHAALTARQLEILVLLGRGLGPSEIGSALGLRSSTVSTHLQRIKTVLSLTTNNELSLYALRAGLAGTP